MKKWRRGKEKKTTKKKKTKRHRSVARGQDICWHVYTRPESPYFTIVTFCRSIVSELHNYTQIPVYTVSIIVILDSANPPLYELLSMAHTHALTHTRTHILRFSYLCIVLRTDKKVLLTNSGLFLVLFYAPQFRTFVFLK